MSLLEKKYWKGLEELHEDPKFLEGRTREFAEELPLSPILPTSRRDFLKLLGFSFAGAALASCTRMPVEKAIPYLVKPEEIVPGVATWYATTCRGCSSGCALLVKNRDGRPIKIEGNPDSPLAKGGVCATGQATVLSLYDDARLEGPLLEGRPASWDEVDGRVRKALADSTAQGGDARSPSGEARSGFAGRGGDARSPYKVVLLTGTITSPTTRELIGEWLRAVPGSEHIAYDAVSLSAIPEANEKSFGIKALPHYRFDRARVIVGLNCDFLGTWISPVEFARAYAEGRKHSPGSSSMSRHVQFESRMSLTGSNADLRVPIRPSEEWAIVTGILDELLGKASSGNKAITETAKELQSARGESLVVSGTNDVAIQTAVNAINALLGNIGKTVDLDNPSFQKMGDEAAFARLVSEMNAGQVAGLILYGVNPVYDAPEAAAFASGLKKTAFSVSFSDRLDETSSLVTAVCPDHHPLEAWDDVRPVANVHHLQQPVIRPIHNTRAAQESLLKWMGRSETYYDYLRGAWKARLSPLNFETSWDQTVQSGVWTTAETTPSEHRFIGTLSDVGAQLIAPLQGNASALELVLYEPIAIRDGRHANNPWLQELPDPVTKITWDNYAQLAPSTAKALELSDGDVVRLKAGKKEIEIPIQTQPGLHPRAVSIAVGYGRTRCGKAGEHVGVNAYPLAGTAGAAVLEKTGRRVDLAATQTHHSMEGRPIVKETTFPEFLKNPAAGNEEHEKLLTLWAERPKEGHQWGMAVDLSACIGCSACIIGCQAENNVPVVGKDEVHRRREMHWIRIDRYYAGDENNPETVHQPMMCQHCGHAPCETVCPVLATVHSSDGLNQQVYNRCVGTRYCANNCPYKVRRFNWFDYAHNDKFDFNMNSDLGTMVLNPDIVVRSRGVMEKCSLCVQRIQEGKLAAKREGRPLKDGEIKMACEQSCPTEAIVFGDLSDPGSRLSKLNQDGRFYHVLEELNVRPNVGYLTKIRNKA